MRKLSGFAIALFLLCPLVANAGLQQTNQNGVNQWHHEPWPNHGGGPLFDWESTYSLRKNGFECVIYVGARKEDIMIDIQESGEQHLSVVYLEGHVSYNNPLQDEENRRHKGSGIHLVLGKVPPPIGYFQDLLDCCMQGLPAPLIEQLKQLQGFANTAIAKEKWDGWFSGNADSDK